MDSNFIRETERPLWDAFVDHSPQGSLFCKSWYLDALGADYRILAVREGEEILGGIVLTRDRWGYQINPVLVKYLGMLYRAFEGHPYNAESRRREVQRALLESMRDLSSFEYTFHPDHPDSLLLQQQGFRQATRYTYRMALSNGDGDARIVERMAPRLRSKISKVRREGSHRIRPVDDMHRCMDLLAATYERRKTRPPYSRELLEVLITTLRSHDAIDLLAAEDGQGDAKAVLGIFYDRFNAYLILNALKDPGEDRGLNEYLILEGICRAQLQGKRQFDFEGSMIPSVESFYRQFGGKLTPYNVIWMPSSRKRIRDLKQQLF